MAAAGPGPSGVLPSRPWLPERVCYGRPAAEAVPAALGELGLRRAFLLVSRSLRGGTGAVEGVAKALGDACAGMYDGMPAHSPRAEVLLCAERVRASGADAIVTIGGGSLTDAAKGVQIVLAHGITDEEEMDSLRRPAAKAPPLPVRCIAVPTTLSAGEFSNYAGITDSRSRRKQPFFHPDCAPLAVVFDPAITVHTPEWLWLSTGMRSVDHCVEALCQLPQPAGGATPYGDGLAVAGLSLLSTGLRRCREAPSDLEARLQCQLGSFFAVQAARSNRCGASHAIGHTLGGTLGVPHGYTSCAMLASVLRWNAADPASANRQGAVSLALGRPGAAAADAVHDLVVSLGLPATLAEVGVEEKDFELVAKTTMQDPGLGDNPRRVGSWQEVVEVLRLASGRGPVGRPRL